MDHAVALVQAYLQLNGYFTSAEYPILAGTSRSGFRAVTDIDILAFRFPTGEPISRHGRKTPRGLDVTTIDAGLAVPERSIDMIIGEVKEGRVGINTGIRNPDVLKAVGITVHETSGRRREDGETGDFVARVVIHPFDVRGIGAGAVEAERAAYLQRLGMGGRKTAREIAAGFEQFRPAEVVFTGTAHFDQPALPARRATSKNHQACQTGDPRSVALALEGLAATHAAAGRSEDAAVLLGAAQARRASVGLPLPDVERVDVDRAEAVARRAVGDDGFEAALERGRALPADQLPIH